MKIKALLLGAAALCLAAPLATAGTPDIDQWSGKARHQLDAKLVHAGIQPGAQVVNVEMRIDGDGLLYSPRLVASTGSLAMDAQITAAVRRVVVEAPPPVLSGRSVIFQLGVSPAQVASAGAASVLR